MIRCEAHVARAGRGAARGGAARRDDVLRELRVVVASADGSDDALERVERLDLNTSYAYGLRVRDGIAVAVAASARARRRRISPTRDARAPLRPRERRDARILSSATHERSLAAKNAPLAIFGL